MKYYVLYGNDNGVQHYELSKDESPIDLVWKLIREHDDDPEEVVAMIVATTGEILDADGINIDTDDDTGPGEDAIQTWDGSWRVF